MNRLKVKQMQLCFHWSAEDELRSITVWGKTLPWSLAVHQWTLLYLSPDGSRDVGGLKSPAAKPSCPGRCTLNANLWCFHSSSSVVSKNKGSPSLDLFTDLYSTISFLVWLNLSIRLFSVHHSARCLLAPASVGCVGLDSYNTCAVVRLKSKESITSQFNQAVWSGTDLLNYTFVDVRYHC